MAKNQLIRSGSPHHWKTRYQPCCMLQGPTPNWLEVSSWIPRRPCSWCTNVQAKGLTLPSAFSAKVFPLTHATALLSRVFRPIPWRAFKTKGFNWRSDGSLWQRRTIFKCPNICTNLMTSRFARSNCDLPSMFQKPIWLSTTTAAVFAFGPPSSPAKPSGFLKQKWKLIAGNCSCMRLSGTLMSVCPSSVCQAGWAPRFVRHACHSVLGLLKLCWNFSWGWCKWVTRLLVLSFFCSCHDHVKVLFFGKFNQRFDASLSWTWSWNDIEGSPCRKGCKWTVFPEHCSIHVHLILRDRFHHYLAFRYISACNCNFSIKNFNILFHAFHEIEHPTAPNLRTAQPSPVATFHQGSSKELFGLTSNGFWWWFEKWRPT